jgi:hypothetical protein
VDRFRNWLFNGSREAGPAPDKPQTPPSSKNAPGDTADARLKLGPFFALLVAGSELHKLVERDGGLHL